MKQRIEKKKAYNTLHWHMDGVIETICYRRHQSKLESSRERRVASTVRRIKRKENPPQKPFNFRIRVDMTEFNRSMSRMIVSLNSFGKAFRKEADRVHE